MKKQPERPVLITDAARSQRDQIRSREIRYVTMMGLRAACLILGAILISLRPPLLAVWLILCAAGMVLLPWAAVLIANDRPPLSKAERAAAAARNQAEPPMLAQQSAEEVDYLTIDSDVVGESEPRESAAEPSRERRESPAEPSRERRREAS